MGSYAVSCGVSKLPICSGDKAAIILISKSKYSTLDSMDHSCNLVSNDGAYGAFFGIGLPIFGTYNDYGGLENYVEDANYFILKKFVEENSYSFDEFMDNLYCGDAPQLKGMKIAGMFIHGDFYDRVLEGNSGCHSSLELNSYALKLMGFTKTDEETGDDRYKYMYRYNDTDIEIHSDGKWCHPIINGKNHGVYSPYSLKSILEKNYEVEIDITMFTGLSKFDVLFDEFRDKLINIKEKANAPQVKKANAISSKIKSPVIEKLLKELSESLKDGVGSNPDHYDPEEDDYDFMLNWKYRELFEHYPFRLSSTLNYDTIKENYIDAIIDGSIKKELVRWVRFYWFMYSTNTILLPSTSGEQDGNYLLSRKLYTIAASIANEHIQEEYNDDCE